MIASCGGARPGAVASPRFDSDEERVIECVSPSGSNAEPSDDCGCSDRSDWDDAIGRTTGVSGAWVLQSGTERPCSLDESGALDEIGGGGREDGGGGSRGITGDAGGDGGDGDVATGEDTPLRPARIAGTGVAMATWNDGGGAKYPSSTSAPMSEPPAGGGVGGGLSAYDSLSPTTAPVLLDDHSIDGVGVSGVPSSALVGSFEGEAAGVYGGGAVLMTVPGKYLGTKGTGPCMGGPSSEASVWNVLIDEVSRRVSR